MFRAACVAVVLIGTALAIAQQPGTSSLPLRRTVQQQTITSQADPAVRITVDPAFKHIGGDRFILYDVADAELHLFVDADAEKRVKRLYWIQFEGYLPNNQHTYNYKGEVAQIGGMNFFSDVRLRSGSITPPPNSDGGHTMRLLESAGYRVEGDPMRERLVHLTDDSKRSELMIIYMEFLPSSSAAEMGTEPQTNPKWPELMTALRKRARDGLRIQR